MLCADLYVATIYQTVEISIILPVLYADLALNILKDFRNAPPAKMLIYCQNVIF